MTEHERRAAAVGTLHRMITYARDEAVRLRVMDVAVLLDRAGETVTAFAPSASNRRSPASSARNPDRIEH